MITRILQTKIWKDEFFAELTSTEKLLFIYFLTNERVNIIHCYEITEREIYFDTGVSATVLSNAKEKFENAGKMRFYKNFVQLCNAHKYESYTGEKNESAKDRLLNQMDEDVRDWLEGDTTIDTPIDTPHKSEIINHKSETKVTMRKKYSSLSDLSDEDFDEIALKYNVPVGFVRSKFDDLTNYCGRSGKRYKNYRLALMDFVKRDAIKIRKEAVSGESKRGIDARNIQ